MDPLSANAVQNQQPPAEPAESSSASAGSAVPAPAPAAAPALPAPAPSPQTDAGLESWTVPLASIDAAGSPFRFRRELKPDAGIKALAASIESEGLLHPLVVRKVGSAFQLVGGFRRHAALSFLARTKGTDPASVPVKVGVLPAGTSDDDALAVSFDENLARKTLDSTEKAIAALKLRDEFGKSMDEIGALLRMKRRQLDRLVDLMGAPEDVRTFFRQGRYGLKAALQLAKVPNAGARSLLIQRSTVRRLRTDKIAAAAALSAAPTAGDAAPEATPAEKVVPEAIRGFVRVGNSSNPLRPFRVTAQLATEADREKLLKYLVRFAN